MIADKREFARKFIEGFILRSPAFRRFAIFAAVLVAVSAAVAAYLSLWMGAGTHPLIVEAKALDGVAIEAALPDGWRAPLVKTSDGKFVTELPPRREYTLFLNAVGKDADIVSVEILKLDEKPAEKILTWKAGDYPVVVKAGTSREFAEDLPVSRGGFLRTFIGIFSFVALIAFGFWALFQTKPEVLPAACKPRGLCLWQWAFVAGLAGLHLWLVFTATPIFWPADSIGYAIKATAFYNHGMYSTGEGYYEITRAPGAPLVEALAWKLFGYSVGSVVILQGILFSAAAVFALDSLSRAVSPPAATIVAPFIFLSPPALFNDRIFASESVYFASALVASACFLRLMASENNRRYLWSIAAGIFISYAAMTRINGVVMLALPIFMLGLTVFNSLKTHRLPETRVIALWLIPIVFTGLALSGWALRNKIVLDRFAISDIKGLSAAEACFKNGILDVRASADDDDIYAKIETGRYASNYNFEAWALAALYQKRIADMGPLDKYSPRKADTMLGDFAARTSQDAPVQAKAACFVRIFEWGTFLHRDANFQPFGTPCFLFTSFDDKSWDYTSGLISGWISPGLVYKQREIGYVQTVWNKGQFLYAKLLPAIVALAFAAFVLSAVNGWLMPMIFLLPYFGNVLLNTLLGVVISRLVLVLEPFLWIGMVLVAYECVKRRPSKDEAHLA
jgi:hypothetical protein